MGAESAVCGFLESYIFLAKCCLVPFALSSCLKSNFDARRVEYHLAALWIKVQAGLLHMVTVAVHGDAVLNQSGAWQGTDGSIQQANGGYFGEKKKEGYLKRCSQPKGNLVKRWFSSLQRAIIASCPEGKGKE